MLFALALQIIPVQCSMMSYITMTSYPLLAHTSSGERYVWCINFEKFFSLTYQLAKLAERPL